MKEPARKANRRERRGGELPMLERVQEAPAQTLALRASGTVVARDIEVAIGASLGEAATGLVIVIDPDFEGDFAELARDSSMPRWLTGRWSSSRSLSIRNRWTERRSTTSRLRPSAFASSRTPTRTPRSNGRRRLAEANNNARASNKQGGRRAPRTWIERQARDLAIASFGLSWPVVLLSRNPGFRGIGFPWISLRPNPDFSMGYGRFSAKIFCRPRGAPGSHPRPPTGPTRLATQFALIQRRRAAELPEREPQWGLCGRAGSIIRQAYTKF